MPALQANGILPSTKHDKRVAGPLAEGPADDSLIGECEDRLPIDGGHRPGLCGAGSREPDAETRVALLPIGPGPVDLRIGDDPQRRQQLVDELDALPVGQQLGLFEDPGGSVLS